MHEHEAQARTRGARDRRRGRKSTFGEGRRVEGNHDGAEHERKIALSACGVCRTFAIGPTAMSLHGSKYQGEITTLITPSVVAEEVVRFFDPVERETVRQQRTRIEPARRTMFIIRRILSLPPGHSVVTMCDRRGPRRTPRRAASACPSTRRGSRACRPAAARAAPLERLLRAERFDRDVHAASVVSVHDRLRPAPARGS